MTAMPATVNTGKTKRTEITRLTSPRGGA